MRIMIDIFLAAALFSMTAALIRTVYRTRFMPLPRTADSEMYIVLAVSGGASGLEQTAAGLCRLDKTVRLGGRLVLLDRGLDASGREVARVLAKDGKALLLSGEDGLKELFLQ